MLTLSITQKYLLIPVRLGAEKQLLTVFSAQNREQKLYEFEVPFPRHGESPDWFAAIPMRRHRGETLLLCAPIPDEELSAIRQAENRPEPAPGRPILHFAPEHGWMNDPNGLIRLADGTTRLYYQYYPFGTEWGMMHWGSARSRDLLHWEAGEIALFPDEHGTMFSGGGWRDAKNDAGFGKDALLFYYTSAGGTEAPWSRDGVFTQRLAVSTDNGETLEKQPGLLLPNLAHANRDPKVFYHEPSNSYCMALYLSGNDFALFRSPDLVHWEQTQFLTLPDMWECPDLFPLSADGEEKWVFWSADGYYAVGSFDGRRFTPEQPVRMAYGNRIPYAAQTVAGEEGRVLSIAWLRLPNAGRSYTGVMALPAELRLVRDGEGWALRLHPCRELFSALRDLPERKAPDAPWLLRSTIPADAGRARLSFPGGEILLDMNAGTGRFGETDLTFPPKQPLSLSLLADRAVFELTLADGAFWAPEQNLSPTLAGKPELTGENGAAIPFTLCAVE